MPDGLRRRVAAAIAERVSPERTRRPTLLERLTVQRLSWDSVVRLNRYLGLAGKLATVIWVAFVWSLVFGVDWKDVVEAAINSGQPLENALILAIALPTLAFLAACSLIGFARWRLQRELWPGSFTLERVSRARLIAALVALLLAAGVPAAQAQDPGRWLLTGASGMRGLRFDNLNKWFEFLNDRTCYRE